MPRKVRLSLESLEGRAMLSGVPTSTTGLADSMTAVASKAAGGGAQVALTFTETNVSDHDISVSYGPSNDAFQVTSGGKFVWGTNAGLMIPAYLQLKTLAPGQSLTVQGTWDGRPDDQFNPAKPGHDPKSAPVSGTFTVSNSLDDGSATATVTIPKAWLKAAKPLTTGHPLEIPETPIAVPAKE